MKIKISSIDNFLIIFLMLSIILPVGISKLFVIISNIFILFRIFEDKKILISSDRIFIFILILPGFFLTIINSPQEIIRFFIILILIFKFPIKELNINKKIIMNFSILILIYLIFTQIAISFKVDWLISFRDNFYHSIYFHVWDSESYFNLSKNYYLLNFSGEIRAGGLFHNPNLLAMVILLYFFIFDTCYSSLKKKGHYRLLYKFLFLIVIYSLILTFSRTAIGGFLIYTLIKNTNFFKNLILFRIKKNFIFYSIFFLVIVFKMFDPFIENFSSIDSSGGVKLQIFLKYINNSNIFKILFGGTHDVFFDNEYGNWIGAVGLFGFVGLIILCSKIYNNNQLTLPFFVTLIAISLGNTIFYGLLTSNIVYVYLLINCTNSKYDFNSHSMLK